MRRRKRPYVQWEKQASALLGSDVDWNIELKSALVKPIARALHKAFVRGYARSSSRRRKQA